MRTAEKVFPTTPPQAPAVIVVWLSTALISVDAETLCAIRREADDECPATAWAVSPPKRTHFQLRQYDCCCASRRGTEVSRTLEFMRDIFRGGYCSLVSTSVKLYSNPRRRRLSYRRRVQSTQPPPFRRSPPYPPSFAGCRSLVSGDRAYKTNLPCSWTRWLSWSDLADKPEATVPHDVAKRTCVEIRRI